MGSPVQGVSFMRKSVFVLAVIGAACSSVAFAAEVKKDKAHIPAVKATTMSDSDMDKVTGAGFDVLNQNGEIFHSNVNLHGAINGFNGQGKNAACNTLKC
jgi:hypothetical protein